MNLSVQINSDAVTKLIDCVSKGIGTLYDPLGKILDAKATVSGEMILAKGDVAKQQLLGRAARRIAHTEARRQANIEAIAGHALKELPASVSNKPVSEDWTAQFFESCQDVGEEEMQKLWARILAGEVTKPGNFSRRLLQLLKTFDAKDAKAFTGYCSVCFSGFEKVFSFDMRATADCLGGQIQVFMPHLVSIGLLEAQDRTYLSSQMSGWKIAYFGKTYELYLPITRTTNSTGPAQIPLRFLTFAGHELLKVVTVEVIPNFFESQRFGLLEQRLGIKEVTQDT